MKYYILVDNSVQWFTKLVALDEHDKVKEFLNFHAAIGGSFVDDIFSREPHFTNKQIEGETYVGWTISQTEYNRLQRINALYPSFREFIQLTEIR